ncbi:hypothetical protein PUN28_004643 [Cardiocondyla obscurior]|uniref:Uncharacterized protein n=1 Tax=Cardiocondyla obscurior TaxID=286306 RepID=A0AAW2GDS2_9HYME
MLSERKSVEMLIAGIQLFLNPVFVHLHKDAVERHLIKTLFLSLLQIIFCYCIGKPHQVETCLFVCNSDLRQSFFYALKCDAFISNAQK